MTPPTAEEEVKGIFIHQRGCKSTGEDCSSGSCKSYGSCQWQQKEWVQFLRSACADAVRPYQAVVEAARKLVREDIPIPARGQISWTVSSDAVRDVQEALHSLPTESAAPTEGKGD